MSVESTPFSSYTHARGAASSENAILRFDLLSTPRAHYRLFVQSTRTIKINIFRERVGTQVFHHSDFREGGGGYAMACRRCCRCSSTRASSAPCLPYRISFHVAPRGGVRLHPLCPRARPLNNESFPSFPPWPAAERSATQGRIALEFPAVTCLPRAAVRMHETQSRDRTEFPAARAAERGRPAVSFWTASPPEREDVRAAPCDPSPGRRKQRRGCRQDAP